MKLEILRQARQDLLDGYWFYEDQSRGLGAYFKLTLQGEIDSLRRFAGIHRVVPGGYHRLISKKFPYAVYYRVVGGSVQVHFVVDCRRSPEWIRRHLGPE